MVIPLITEETIHRYSSDESYRRGMTYYQGGAVISIIKRGERYLAKVQGSYIEPYTTTVNLHSGEQVTADCTCLYSYGGWCKHIVATCLKMIHKPESIEEGSTLATLLADLSREQLLKIIEKLVTNNDDLMEQVELHVDVLKSMGVTNAQGEKVYTRMDPGVVHRRLQKAFAERESYSDYDDYDNYGDYDDPALELVDMFLNQFTEIMNAGQEHTILDAFEALAEEYVKGWLEAEEEEDTLYETGQQIAELLTEALLGAGLAKPERKKWQKKLDEWDNQLLVDNRIEDLIFEVAKIVLEHGWDYAPLKRVLEGNASAEDVVLLTAEGGDSAEQNDDWDEEEDEDEDEYEEDGAEKDSEEYYRQALTTVRLHVLERHGRQQEYLNLAQAMKCANEYTNMLIKLGRKQEAVTVSLEQMKDVNSVLTLAKALYAEGDSELAMRVAEHGMQLPDTSHSYYNASKHVLAKWISGLVSWREHRALTLAAAHYVFLKEINLANYLRVQEIAGEHWSQWRTQLLDHVRQANTFAGERIPIFLHEGLIDDAISTLEKNRHLPYSEEVLRAAATERPEWILRFCEPLAEEIMRNSTHTRYAEAVRYLRYVKEAYIQLGKSTVWNTYFDELRTRYRTKRKLQEYLNELA